jgi:hypothetical protein
LSHEFKELLKLHFVYHQTCAVDEHYSIGTSENAVGRLRETALELLLQANLASKVLGRTERASKWGTCQRETTRSGGMMVGYEHIGPPDLLLNLPTFFLLF